MESSGFVPRFDSRFRYYLEEEKPLKQLKSLLHFTEEDQLLLYQAIDYLSPHTKSGALLKEKLGSLYDYSRLGTSYLRKPYLRKVDLLLQAKEDKKQVLLHGYRSGNSNVISNRLVEPFHPSPPDDILHAWDVEKSDKTRIETVFARYDGELVDAFDFFSRQNKGWNSCSSFPHYTAPSPSSQNFTGV